MNWYYVDAGQQAGPVDDGQLAELARSGKIQLDTLVWREGMTGWAAYGEAVPGQAVPPLAPEVGVPPGPSPAAAGGLVCCECGRTFAPDEVIRHADKWVCATCKPIFLQRLREGVNLTGAGPPGSATEADLLARDYQVDIGGCVSQAWKLFKTSTGNIVGATALVGLALMGSGIIPYLGILLSVIFRGPLLGGLWSFYIKKVRGQPAAVNDAFSGFGPRFGQLFLTQLIPFLIAIGGVVVFVVFALLAGMTVGRGGARNGAGALAVFVIPMVVLGAAFVVVMIYLTVCWLFSLPLVADKGLKFWPALTLSRRIVCKHWWMTFLLLFVCGLIAAAGALGCGAPFFVAAMVMRQSAILAILLVVVGFIACFLSMLLTGPVAFGTLTYHYERVFGDLIPSQG